MADTRQICWVAGLLEGEGCFQNRSDRYCSPLIQLMMTDKDVVVSAAKVLGAHKVVKCKQDTRTNKSIYRLNVYGRLSIEWMMTLYVLMGERRQAKIREILNQWRFGKKSPYPERKSYSRGAEVVWSRETWLTTRS